jgi:hypothetical protein
MYVPNLVHGLGNNLGQSWPSLLESKNTHISNRHPTCHVSHVAYGTQTLAHILVKIDCHATPKH